MGPCTLLPAPNCVSSTAVFLPLGMKIQIASVAPTSSTQDFVYQVLRAYLARCGVSCSTFRRFPSMNQPQLVAEQFTIKALSAATEYVSVTVCGG